MSTRAGAYALGPDSATLKVWTGKEGRAARAGHNLEIEVTDWSATLELGATPEQTTVSLMASSRSLRVLAGSGGVPAFDDANRPKIDHTIETEVLNGGEISFRSTGAHGVEGADDVHVHGDLTLLRRTAPVAFTLAVSPDGSVSAEARIKQTDFGIKPHSAMLGALKVSDEVRITVEGRLDAS